jgi:CHASE2 domain-containing sensor protein
MLPKMLPKLFRVFILLALGFLLVIQAFDLRDTTEPFTILMMLGLFLSCICAASAFIAHAWSS